MRKPYFKKSRNCWYVAETGTRREIRLHENEEEAYKIWHGMLAARTAVGPNVSYHRLADEFLREHFEDRPRFLLTTKRIAKFAIFLGNTRACDVSKQDVVRWLNEDKPGKKKKDKDGKWVDGTPVKWSARTKSDAYNEIGRVFRWAMQQGILARNPIAGLKMQSHVPRSTTITPEQREQLLAACDPCFRLYLIACASTGARPRQIREVEASNVMDDHTAWIFYHHKMDSGGKPLVVYLSPCMQTISRMLVAARPEGPLFLNSKGGPWKKNTVVHKMTRLRKKLGLPDNVINYAFRHTYATNSLLQGNSLQTVAELLGHKDSRMVSRVYGHLDQHRHHLAEAARITNMRK